MYVIHASNRGFWRAKSKGYTLNPGLAGQFTGQEVSEICGGLGSERKEKSYPFNGSWHRKRMRTYLERKQSLIQQAMEGMTSDQVIEIMPDLIFERRKRNG